MAFRTVIVDSHSKLEYSLEYLVYRTVNETKRIFLDEIHTLIIQSTAVSLTSALISELSKRKIKVIFCDEKKNPVSELVPYYNAHNSSGRVFEQMNWNDSIKDRVWKEIIFQKIRNQAASLLRKNKKDQYNQLIDYANNIEQGDITNREGHAAKIYFNFVYFEGFTRDKDCFLNACLNYGYTILLSQFNRAITSSGYLTQVGIHHKNEYNQFNLSCDLIEPFRFLIDDFVEQLNENGDWKEKIIEILNKEVEIDGKKQTVTNAINVYSQSVFNALENNDPSVIKFVKNDI